LFFHALLGVERGQSIKKDSVEMVKHYGHLVGRFFHRITFSVAGGSGALRSGEISAFGGTATS
jgi:hypothetical protein